MSCGEQSRFYHSPEWRRTREAFLESRNWICERCGAPATVAHHRRYVTPGNVGDPAEVLDMGNLEALCPECHNREHFGGASTAEGLAFDARGNIVRI